MVFAVLSEISCNGKGMMTDVLFRFCICHVRFVLFFRGKEHARPFFRSIRYFIFKETLLFFSFAKELFPKP